MDFRNKTIRQSAKCAIDGFIYCCKTEKNFKFDLINIIISLIINILAGFSLIQFLIYFVVVIGTLSAECANTAIERICDFLTKDKNEDIRIIKDVGSAIVGCWAITFYAVEIIMVVYNLVS